MKRKITFLFLIFGFFSFTAAHKFYVSVTEIEHNEKEKRLQIISRVFTDDLENVLKQRYDPELRLGKKVETEGADKHISNYLKSKLQIEIDGATVEVNFLGKEYENDMTIFYIESQQISDFKKIKIKNSLLMDLFEEQRNLIHVIQKGRTKSLILIDGKEEDFVKF